MILFLCIYYNNRNIIEIKIVYKLENSIIRE